MQSSSSISQSESSISLLLVEDSASDISLVRRMLERAEPKYHVSGAERLATAIALAQSQRFDIALLDLTLPDSDGLSTVEAFVSAVADVPTIVLTILDDEALALQAITQAAQDYLIKDAISPEALARSIRYSIERGRLVSQIRTANKELEAFSYSAAHDLKSPLRGIIGLADILLDATDGDVEVSSAAMTYAQHIRDNAVRMSQLVTDLLAYSRVKTTRLEIVPVDLGASLRGALAQLQIDIDSRQAQITVDTPLPRVMGYPPLVVQAIANLLSNAIKFTAPDVQPHIFIRAEVGMKLDVESVRLWVIDNGIGISDQHHDRIFRIFERLNSRDDYAGSGVGLAITQQAIARMGGSVGVESIGKGSQFWLELPLA
ncbi:MAG: ATP-binding protein [Elainellaceae cyanobacterium]